MVSSDESSRAHATKRSELSKRQQNPMIDSRRRKAKRRRSFEGNSDSNCSLGFEARPSFPRRLRRKVVVLSDNDELKFGEEQTIEQKSS